MNQTIPNPVDFEKPISRVAIFTLINTAMRVKEFRFARQTALAWLAAFPGDLAVNFAHAQALYNEEKYSQVNPIIEDLCLKDPEYIPAQRIRTKTQVFKNLDIQSRAQANIYAMTGESRSGLNQPEWSQLTWTARQALQNQDLEKAERLIHQALVGDLPSPIPAVLHLQITRVQKDYQTIQNLARLYSARWPECIEFKLFLAEALIETGEETESVALLHECAARDAAGQVAARIWGTDHPYKALWPQQLEILFDIPVPAAVAAALGWNQLAGGPPPTPTAPQTETAAEQPVAEPIASGEKSVPQKEANQVRISPDVLRSIQDELERLAQRLRTPGTGRADGRYPVYVVFSTRHGLEDHYGPQTASIVVSEMKNLVEAIRKRENWGALLFLADDPVCMAALGLKPVSNTDPWKLKLAISDLDALLSKKGEMIGSMLIVGGPEIVPFHKLPNPTDDGDADVPSDNPYASLDQNYFIPDWPIGRLPGGVGTDAGMLLAALRRIVAYQTKYSKPTPWWQRSNFFRNLFKRTKSVFAHGPARKNLKASFGYSAAVWKQSSMAVYKTIGDPDALLTCPPAVSGTVQDSQLMPAYLNYFNLHGLEDAAEWYGQRDPSAVDRSGVDYPVALSPKDLSSGDQAAKFIFSEACYGAYIADKTENESIALKFIANGSLAMVGSTRISYGAVTTPLIAADLLAYYFWKNLQEGKTAGESFQQAKISLVDEMNKRQGYLDGEDQKTLISFVLLGDPLAAIEEQQTKQKAFSRPQAHPAVHMVCDEKTDEMVSNPVPEEMLTSVKKVVDQYLPGLKDAEFAFSRQQPMFDDEGHSLPGLQMGAKVAAPHLPERTVVRLSKQVQGAKYMHRTYARVTLDAKGKVIKMSVSR